MRSGREGEEQGEGGPAIERVGRRSGGRGWVRRASVGLVSSCGHTTYMLMLVPRGEFLPSSISTRPVRPFRVDEVERDVVSREVIGFTKVN